MLFKTKCYLVVAMAQKAETVVAIADTREEAIAFAAGSEEAMKLVEATDVFAFAVQERALFDEHWKDVEEQQAASKEESFEQTHFSPGNG